MGGERTTTQGERRAVAQVDNRVWEGSGPCNRHNLSDQYREMECTIFGTISRVNPQTPLEAAVEAVAYSTFRNNLKSYMEKTRDDAETLLVTSNDPSNNVVVMNARDYESLMETIRIYKNPYLHTKIARGMQQAREGRATRRELLDD